jgi:hypothetical protein
MKIEYYGYIEKGTLHLENRRRFEQEIKSAKDMDVTIIIKKRGKRSSQANRYYWGVLIEEIRQDIKRRGERVEADTIHEFLKEKFSPNKTKIEIEATGELLELPGSTTTMNVSEFSEYLERIIEWCATTLELVIPPPNTQTSLFNDQNKAA